MAMFISSIRRLDRAVNPCNRRPWPTACNNARSIPFRINGTATITWPWTPAFPSRWPSMSPVPMLLELLSVGPMTLSWQHLPPVRDRRRSALRSSERFAPRLGALYACRAWSRASEPGRSPAPIVTGTR